MTQLPDLDDPMVTVEDFMRYVFYMQKRLEEFKLSGGDSLEPVLTALRNVSLNSSEWKGAE